MHKIPPVLLLFVLMPVFSPGISQPSAEPSLGFNIRGITHYGYPELLPYAPADHADSDLAALKAMHGSVVRVFVGNNQVSWGACAHRLDLFLTKAEAAGVSVIPSLIDFYKSRFYPSGTDGFYTRTWNDLIMLDESFFSQGYKDAYKSFVDTVVKANRHHTGIYAWEIGNELKNENNNPAFIAFMQDMSGFIKTLDPDHRVATGMISAAHTGLTPENLYPHLTTVDIITVHAYDGDHSGSPDMDWAAANGKIAILEEVGIGGTADRSASMTSELNFWLGKGAAAILPWGLIARGLPDNGDGDTWFGIDNIWHTDYDQLAALFQSTFAQPVSVHSSRSPDCGQKNKKVPLDQRLQAISVFDARGQLVRGLAQARTGLKPRFWIVSRK